VTTTPSRPRVDNVTPVSVAAALGGFAVALFGVYWDDAWHTDRGRDEFASAPHLVLYVGVTLALAVVAWWGWCRRELGWRALGSGPIGIAIVGAAVTLGSSPVDEWWHTTFGRDAVLWSPPHLVALVGTIALGSGVVLVAGNALPARSRRTASVLLVATGAGVIGGWQVLVLEYDTDVAQFSPVWYLPVLAVGLSAAGLTVQAAIGHRVRWAAAWSGVAYTLAMIIIIGVLSAAGFSKPIVPIVVVALVVADLGQQRAWPVLLRAAGFVAALFAIYVPYLGVVAGGVAPSAGQALGGAGFALVAVVATILVFDPTARWHPSAGSAVVVAAALAMVVVGVIGARSAYAHDPGQGSETSEIELNVEVSGTRVEVVATFEDLQAGIEPVRVVARRAGRELVGPLTGDDFQWFGWVDLDRDGRWFVYVEARQGSDRFEAWLPVTAGADGSTSKQTDLYLVRDASGTGTAQLVTGAVLALVALSVVGRIAVTVRAAWHGTVDRSSRRRST